jgi:hypothetical protein
LIIAMIAYFRRLVRQEVLAEVCRDLKRDFQLPALEAPIAFGVAGDVAMSRK